MRVSLLCSPEALRISDLSKVTSSGLRSALQPLPCPQRFRHRLSCPPGALLRLHPRFARRCERGPRLPAKGKRGAGVGQPCTASAQPPAPTGLQVMAIAFALEVSVGKTNTVMALNSSNVLLPCTFTTCIGFQDLVFTWYFNSTELIYQGKIKSKTSEPTVVTSNPRVEFVGSTTGKDNNISIVLSSVEFSDAGKYTCHVKNPREKNAQHNATIFLTVVQKSKCGWQKGSGGEGLQMLIPAWLPGVAMDGVSSAGPLRG
ncbi:sodium channel subunit beta-4 isoform X2 [Pogoniulus pusillus]|uniref:sodium channel subunit beta-4 isoform X2 n=1 Tax=Pogoniulus pusillus TaxID=488313 RepID=UPI0030B99DFD